MNGFIDYNITRLYVNNCQISSIPIFSEKSSIYTLSIENNPLIDITNIGTIGNLLHIRMKGCWNIQDISPLNNVKSLQTISISLQPKQLKIFVEAVKDKEYLEDIKIEILGTLTTQQEQTLNPIKSKISELIQKSV